MTDLFLKSLQPLGQYLKLHDAALADALHRAHAANPWFIPEFTYKAIDAVTEEYLDEAKCKNWLEGYSISNDVPKRVAIIMAGNVPLVGFHDLMCVLASGHHAIIKLSEKDSILSGFITDAWTKIEPSLHSRISYTDKLENFDAVIATGSNNSARYFEYYFRNHPHILRKNRNGVAVLTGNESPEQLKALSNDMYLYFGLGCRNVSKLYVPPGYDFSQWNEAMSEWNYLSDHNKYRHNLDYNYAIYIINRVPHIHFDQLILKEDDAIASRIGCVHYGYYKDKEQLLEELEVKRNLIQCVVSVDPIHGWEHISPGRSQYPALKQYADGADTMRFLTSLAE